MENGDRLEKWYESKVVFLISVLTPVVIILVFLFSMKTDIALLDQKVDTILSTINDYKKMQISQEDKIVELEKEFLVLKKGK